jgi:hypothetical protein
LPTSWTLSILKAIAFFFFAELRGDRTITICGLHNLRIELKPS